MVSWTSESALCVQGDLPGVQGQVFGTRQKVSCLVPQSVRGELYNGLCPFFPLDF